MLRLFQRPVLTPEQRQSWDREGFLIPSGFFPRQKIDAVNAEVAELLDIEIATPNVSVDILSGRSIGKRVKIADAPEDAFRGPVKINDLFLDSDIVRSCNLDDGLAPHPRRAPRRGGDGLQIP